VLARQDPGIQHQEADTLLHRPHMEQPLHSVAQVLLDLVPREEFRIEVRRMLVAAAAALPVVVDIRHIKELQQVGKLHPEEAVLPKLSWHPPQNHKLAPHTLSSFSFLPRCLAAQEDPQLLQIRAGRDSVDHRNSPGADSLLAELPCWASDLLSIRYLELFRCAQSCAGLEGKWEIVV
jgi:hypothetical protein